MKSFTVPVNLVLRVTQKAKTLLSFTFMVLIFEKSNYTYFNYEFSIVATEGTDTKISITKKIRAKNLALFHV